MARPKVKEPKHTKELKGIIELEPPVTQQGLPLLVRGSGWSAFPLAVQIDKGQSRPQRILLGSPVEGGFRPSPQGEFLLELTTRNLERGRHLVRVKPLCNPRFGSAS
jgi:hypothetical protein